MIKEKDNWTFLGYIQQQMERIIMLKEFKKPKPEEKAEVKKEIKALRERLLMQQQLIKEQKLPILILVEGWAAAGKGSLINELISEIDPRFYNVTSPVIVPETEERYPFLYPFAKAIPETARSCSWIPAGWKAPYGSSSAVRSPKTNTRHASATSMSSSVSSGTAAMWC